MGKSDKDLEFNASPEGLRKPIKLFPTLAICSGGWLVPGLSHILLGKWVRGLIFAACVFLMFALGLGMHGRLFDLVIEEPLEIFAFVANVGVGLPYMLAEKLGFGIGSMNAVTYDYGTTYLWVAGLLNYLIILDAFDIAQGRKP
jgi:Family of unknown function (DUF6677)